MKLKECFQRGTKLRNGAEVIHFTENRDGGVVLAVWQGNEYVTWRVTNDGHTWSGNYFQSDFQSACNDYFERVR